MDRYNLENTYSHKSLSWEIQSKTVVMKKCDLFLLDYHETDIPDDIRWFFGVENLKIGEKKRINLLYKGRFFVAYIKNTETNIIRISIDSSFFEESSQELKKFEYYPQLIMRKVSHDIFSSFEVNEIRDLPGYIQDCDTYLISYISDTYEENKNEAETMSLDNLKAKARENSLKEKKQRYISTVVTERDPFIAEYTKRRANGVCQLCGKSAPFNDKKGKPYLESHHIIWLSRGGDDTLLNTVALCPNCHKRMHIVDSPQDIDYLKNLNKDISLD